MCQFSEAHTCVEDSVPPFQGFTVLLPNERPHWIRKTWKSARLLQWRLMVPIKLYCKKQHKKLNPCSSAHRRYFFIDIYFSKTSLEHNWHLLRHQVCVWGQWHQDNSVGNGVFHQPQWPEFDPRDPHSGRRELTSGLHRHAMAPVCPLSTRQTSRTPKNIWTLASKASLLWLCRLLQPTESGSLPGARRCAPILLTPSWQMGLLPLLGVSLCCPADFKFMSVSDSPTSVFQVAEMTTVLPCPTPS